MKMRLSTLPAAALLFFVVQIAFAQSLPSPQVLTMTAGDNSAHAADTAFVGAAVAAETTRAEGAENTIAAIANAALPNTNSAVGSAYSAWFGSLPTTLPATAGLFWDNGGTLSRS